MMLYISGSFPRYKDGIGDSAYQLFKAFCNQYSEIVLLTSDLPEIKEFVEEQDNISAFFVPSWKLKYSNWEIIKKIIVNNRIDCIHLEYPGDGYGKTLLASFIPMYIYIYNKRYKSNIKLYLRLHEFTKARLLRIIVIIPMLVFARCIYIPALHDRTILKIWFKKKVKATLIGTNIENICEKEYLKTDKINIAYFGFVYHGKGIERLFKIWSEIKKRDSENKIVFTIIGELNPYNGNHFEEFHKKAYQWLKDYKLIDKVRITGYCENAAEVSKELSNVDIAILPFEDGLTLRRGSFLAFLGHGIPIITTQGDDEVERIFRDCPGIAMTKDDEEVINTVYTWIESSDYLKEIGKKNKEKSLMFEWSEIARDLLKDYDVI